MMLTYDDICVYMILMRLIAEGGFMYNEDDLDMNGDMVGFI